MATGFFFVCSLAALSRHTNSVNREECQWLDSVNEFHNYDTLPHSNGIAWLRTTCKRTLSTAAATTTTKSKGKNFECVGSHKLIALCCWLYDELCALLIKTQCKLIQCNLKHTISFIFCFSPTSTCNSLAIHTMPVCAPCTTKSSLSTASFCAEFTERVHSQVKNSRKKTRVELTKMKKMWNHQLQPVSSEYSSFLLPFLSIILFQLISSPNKLFLAFSSANFSLLPLWSRESICPFCEWIHGKVFGVFEAFVKLKDFCASTSSTQRRKNSLTLPFHADREKDVKNKFLVTQNLQISNKTLSHKSQWLAQLLRTRVNLVAWVKSYFKHRRVVRI